MRARSRLLAAAATLAGTVLLIGNTGLASAQVAAPTVSDSKIVLHSTTDSASFDISWVDQTIGRYFFTDRTNKAVDWFDLAPDPSQDKFVKYLGAGKFSGPGSSSSVGGPNGVVTDDQHRVWAGDGPDSTGVSSIKEIDPNTGDVTTIYLGGTQRADELSYDPVHQLILIANDKEGFLTFVNVVTSSVAAQFFYGDNTVGRAASVAGHNTAGGGIEQSVYNPATGKFYQAVPGAKSTPGFIDVFDPLGKKLENTITVNGCDEGPTGMVLERQRLVGACKNGGVVVDVASGSVLGVVPNVGGADELWYGQDNQQVYFGRSSAAMLGVVNASDTETFANNLDTSAGAHSVAAYRNQILVPIRKGDTGLGVKVFLAS